MAEHLDIKITTKSHPEPQCKSCKYWERYPDTFFVPSASGVGAMVTVPSQRDVGHCRINPPQNEKRYNMWPTTFESDWCGQFRAKE